MDALLRFTRDLVRQRPRHAVRLLDPPFCYGAWRGPRIDIPVLQLRVREALADGARGLVLADIPDDDDSLLAALDLDGVLAALAVGCGHLDLWTVDPVAADIADACTLRRSSGTSLARGEMATPAQVRLAWAVLEAACAESSSSEDRRVR
jgi:hypothetical protein